MRRRKRESYRQTIRDLRELCPTLVPVRVYRRKLKDCLGHTYLVRDADGRPSHFNIAISSTISWDATWQVLIHEWAHAVAWKDTHPTITDHDIEWGVALSRIYSDVIEP